MYIVFYLKNCLCRCSLISKGDKGDRGLTTTFKGDQFPTGIIEGPPGMYQLYPNFILKLVLLFQYSSFFFLITKHPLSNRWAFLQKTLRT